MQTHMLRATLSKITRWTRNHWMVLAAIAGVVVVGAGGFTYTHDFDVAGTQRVGSETSTQEAQQLKPTKQPTQLTGVKVKPEAAKKPVTGVMIENSPGARPQTGLDAADMVFEAVVESGITRFLALYQSNTPDRIGPIRSLRPYFLDWVMGFDTPIAHVGGSAKALRLVKKRGAKDLDQFKHSGPYYRGGGRPSPHNMYSSIKNLQKLQKRKGFNTSTFKSIRWRDDNPANNPGVKRITVNYSGSQYRAQFRYLKNRNIYRRYMAGSPHVDTATGNPITVKNVVVIRMPTRKRGKYAVMDTIGSGKALVFTDGKVTKGKWRQKSPRDRIELLNKQGKQIPLNRGDTWFAIQPKGKPLNY